MLKRLSQNPLEYTLIVSPEGLPGCSPGNIPRYSGTGCCQHRRCNLSARQTGHSNSRNSGNKLKSFSLLVKCPIFPDINIYHFQIIVNPINL